MDASPGFGVARAAQHWFLDQGIKTEVLVASFRTVDEVVRVCVINLLVLLHTDPTRSWRQLPLSHDLILSPN